MDRVESRALTCADCFVQWFVTEGQIRHRITTAREARSLERRPIFTLNVTQRATDRGKTGQHVVIIRQEGNDLVVNHPQLEIALGDPVLWHADFLPRASLSTARTVEKPLIILH